MHKAMAAEMTLRGMKDGWLRPHIGKEYSLEESPLVYDEMINSRISLGKRIFNL